MTTNTAKPDLLADARAALERREWNQSFDLFTQVDAIEGLSPTDLETLAGVAWFSGKGAESLQLTERAFHAHVAAAEKVRAAYLAFELAKQYGYRAKNSIAAAWLRKGEQLLRDEPEGYAHGYEQLVLGYLAHARGETDAAMALAERAVDVGSEFGDADLRAEALTLLGRIRIATGATAEGFANLEEAAAAAVSGELSPFNAGVTYCLIISACRDLTDYQRASEWTAETERWCETQAVTGFPGVCRVHRAEVVALQGGWERAEAELEKATEELKAYEAIPPMGDGFYALGEIKRRRGDLAGAEAALQRAHDLGHSPYPALALIRLAQGKVNAATQSINSAVADENWDQVARSRLLPAQVEILVAASDLTNARLAAEDFDRLVAPRASPALRAAADEAWGRILLAEGEAAEASRRLRSAIKNWREVKAPYEVAVDRVLLAAALRAVGDHDGADLELEAARKTFGELGAQHDLVATERLINSAAARRGEAEQVRKTFMFTDIENSTSLAGAMGNQPWEQLLGWHDETFRFLFSRHAGQVVSTTGDGFFVAFDSARQALHCAIAIQRALVDHRRATGFAPSVRIGLHTDEGTRRGEDYSGQGVHIAARVCALAHGGEIVATSATIAEAGELVTTEAREEKLKGVSQPVIVSTISWA
ncbi:MAG TPA: adenylate/guanylate cyclase domain-containing protein [Acidimicrobiia bacterium]|nr:adenylate/guanylate cyclase domain-containing protein [Acidimicrobiia bacterium]